MRHISWVGLTFLLGLGAGCGSAPTTSAGTEKDDAATAVDAEPDASSTGTDSRDAGPVVPPPSEGCGDGLRESPELCDDGNTATGDGCDAQCKPEDGWNCPADGGDCVPRCGDGKIRQAEQCDDANTESGDGCDEQCALESGWVCLTTGAACESALCGDGVLAGSETCDDGDQFPGDGCNAECQLELGWACPVDGEACVPSECGDGFKAGGEACDDANRDSGDGCTAGCEAVEPNHACPAKGGACTRTSECGDGKLTSDEECDDRNTEAGDGCTDTCGREDGWICTMVGVACRAAECGDGIRAGNEGCDLGQTSSPGCVACQVVDGFACEGASCHATVCNDGVKEGSEPCDDGNSIVGDGCSPFCKVEPRCTQAGCQSACGDGMRLASDVDEECDDGNTKGGDGCSAECKVEAGFSCADVATQLPNAFEIPVIYRDFIQTGSGLNGGIVHPDFNTFGSGLQEGMVGAALGANGKPVYTGICEKNNRKAPCTADGTSSKADFDLWYSDDTEELTVPNISGTVEGIAQRVNGAIKGGMLKYVRTMTMNRLATSETYRNSTFGAELFPLNQLGWVDANLEGLSANRNFGFTSEVRAWFEYKGDEKLTFAGDDDVWVFINGRLAMDLGGVHGKIARTIVLDKASGNAKCYTDEAATTPCATPSRTLGLVVGNVYEMALFHAERHTSQSNFDLTLTGFVSVRSVCESVCGDAVITPDEACDDGRVCEGGTKAGEACFEAGECPGGACRSLNDGSYGHCKANCQGLGLYCGDDVVQTANGEQCDEGFAQNLGGYDGCTQECRRGPRCGDANVDGFYGEQCDLGSAMNTGDYGTCKSDCSFGPRCGDGQVQAEAGETCDDKTNRGTYGGCAPGCKELAPYCGDGKVQSASGEECDKGTAANDGTYGSCTNKCKRAPRCGDGTVQKDNGEACDDGNVNNFDGCSKVCKVESVVI